MPRVTISLGSNLGDRVKHLSAAVRLLKELHVGGPFLCSALYETSPVDCPPDSPTFLNGVVELSTELEPHDFLARTRSFEQQLGRPSERYLNAPRTIDIDLLFFGDTHCDTPELTLPHPRWRERGFVLRPLHDIRPDLVPASWIAPWTGPSSEVSLHSATW